MPRIDHELLEQEYDDLDDARHRRRRGTKPSVAARQRIDDADVARVVAVARGRLEVFHDGQRLPARFGGAMRGTRVVIGDRVRIRPPRHASDVARVLDRLERTTELTRTPDDADDAERPVVANADVAAVVVAADHLEPALGFIDRVMVAASVGGLTPLVVVNKVDLADPDEVTRMLAAHRALGVAVCRTSAVTGEGLDELAEAVRGRWTAFTGHSGVGKSSLFNLLVPDAEQAVSETGRYGGRHTTVAAVAAHVPALDAWLVDTPGVRSFGIGTVTRQTLHRHFPELADPGCELADCTHLGEPGCVLERAAVAPSRWASYERLMAGLEGG
jgi:ribosome biogenesis GTPase